MPPQPRIHVAPVRTPADHRAFWTLPYEIYRDAPAWAAPLRRDERRRWDPARNPTLQTRRVWRFVAWRGRRPVGRIAAVLDPELAARWAPDTGLFGFFESIDEPEVSSGLFHAAESALRAQGVGRMLGPVNLSFHDEMGLLVDGFDHPPAFLTPFNPPYYSHLVERQGYRSSFDQHAYRWTAGAALPPVLERALRRAARAGVVVRGLHREQWEAELRVVHTLYNEAFKGLWGFVPIGWRDFRTRAEGFKSFYRPELVQIAELEGRAVGFALALPDLSPLLAGSAAGCGPSEQRILPLASGGFTRRAACCSGSCRRSPLEALQWRWWRGLSRPLATSALPPASCHWSTTATSRPGA